LLTTTAKGTPGGLWKLLLALYFALLVCDGALRKWVWPEAGVLVFGLKDAVLLLCLFAALVSTKSHSEKMSPRMPTYAVALAFLWFAVVLIRSLSDLDSIATLIGIRYYLIGLPVVYLIYRLLCASGDVHRPLAYVAFAAIAAGLLGAVQFYSPPDSPINRYAWSTMEDVAAFGGELGWAERRARITSTFSYISTYASFLQFALSVLIATAITGALRRQRAIALLALAVVAVNILMTGSRAIALMLALTLVLFVWLFPRRIADMFGNLRRGAFAAVLLFVLALAAIDPLVALIERTSAVREVYGEAEGESRILGSLFAPYFTMVDAGPFGLGVGAAFLGLGELQGAGRADYRFDELTDDRVGIELGIPIYLFVLLAKIFFVLVGARVAVRASTLEVRAWATAMVAYQLMYVWTIPFYNPVASPFYFTSVAVVLFLQARERRWARAGQSHASA
jgi:hypothetical protein